jgi:multidrug resistance efflux pump
MSTATLTPPQMTGEKTSPRVGGRRRFIRRVLAPVLVLALLVAAMVAYSMYREAQLYVSTDNAQLSGEPVQVGSMNAGRVVSLPVKVGDRVSRGAVLAQVALPSQVGVAQNGQAELDFLGNADTKVGVPSPIDGVVIATPVAIGATVQAGQAIVELVDPRQLWVNANIDETSIGRVQVGDAVTVHVDALNDDVPGVVEAITPATAATFSLLPSNNAAGTFNKVAQLVPVRIGVILGDQPALLGTSVEVKIRVRD